MFTALADTAGVLSHRLSPLERVGWVLTDWDAAHANQKMVQDRMVAVLDDLGFTELVCLIKGLSMVGAAVILALDTQRLTLMSVRYHTGIVVVWL